MEGDERREICLGTGDQAEAARLAAVHVSPAAEADTTADHAPDSTALYAVAHALEDLIQRGCVDNAPETRRCYIQRGGHVLRLLGAQPLRSLHLDAVQDFINARLAEGAAHETVRKELVVLRRSLELAHRRGFFPPAPEDVMPRFKTRYVPRKTWLSPQQLAALVRKLEPARQLWVLMAAYLGPRLSELERIEWTDINFSTRSVHVRGKKGKKEAADRMVPLHPRLAAVLEPRRKVRGRVLQPWNNVRRDLTLACEKAGVPRVTPNDLRRTFASWLVQRGETSFVVSQLLGHSTSVMVEKVYGRLAVQTLREAIDKLP